MYNILEAHLDFTQGKLQRVTVLVEISQGDIRAVFSAVGTKYGYDYLQPGEPVNDALLQRVAGFGQRLDETDKLFKQWRAKYAGRGTL